MSNQTLNTNIQKGTILITKSGQQYKVFKIEKDKVWVICPSGAAQTKTFDEVNNEFVDYCNCY